MNIRLPWPSPDLSPNSRKHWAVVCRVKNEYRRECAMEAKKQGAKIIKSNKIHVSVTFYPPTRRSYDLDNLLARMKSGLDGVADTIRVDDKHWAISIQRSDTLGGYVELEIEDIKGKKLNAKRPSNE